MERQLRSIIPGLEEREDLGELEERAGPAVVEGDGDRGRVGAEERHEVDVEAGSFVVDERDRELWERIDRVFLRAPGEAVEPVRFGVGEPVATRAVGAVLGGHAQLALVLGSVLEDCGGDGGEPE